MLVIVLVRGSHAGSHSRYELSGSQGRPPTPSEAAGGCQHSSTSLQPHNSIDGLRIQLLTLMQFPLTAAGTMSTCKHTCVLFPFRSSPQRKKSQAPPIFWGFKAGHPALGAFSSPPDTCKEGSGKLPHGNLYLITMTRQKRKVPTFPFLLFLC